MTQLLLLVSLVLLVIGYLCIVKNVAYKTGFWEVFTIACLIVGSLMFAITGGLCLSVMTLAATIAIICDGMVTVVKYILNGRDKRTCLTMLLWLAAMMLIMVIEGICVRHFVLSWSSAYHLIFR
jgi:hypothetical protein